MGFMLGQLLVWSADYAGWYGFVYTGTNLFHPVCEVLWFSSHWSMMTSDHDDLIILQPHWLMASLTSYGGPKYTLTEIDDSFNP